MREEILNHFKETTIENKFQFLEELKTYDEKIPHALETSRYNLQIALHLKLYSEQELENITSRELNKIFLDLIDSNYNDNRFEDLSSKIDSLFSSENKQRLDECIESSTKESKSDLEIAKKNIRKYSRRAENGALIMASLELLIMIYTRYVESDLVGLTSVLLIVTLSILALLTVIRLQNHRR